MAVPRGVQEVRTNPPEKVRFYSYPYAHSVGSMHDHNFTDRAQLQNTWQALHKQEIEHGILVPVELP